MTGKGNERGKKQSTVTENGKVKKKGCKGCEGRERERGRGRKEVKKGRKEVVLKEEER
jgi:hypothetical protein